MVLIRRGDGALFVMSGQELPRLRRADDHHIHLTMSRCNLCSSAQEVLRLPRGPLPLMESVDGIAMCPMGCSGRKGGNVSSNTFSISCPIHGAGFPDVWIGRDVPMT